MRVFEIPLHGTPQRFPIQLVGRVFTLCFQYRAESPFTDDASGDWLLDIGDDMGNIIVAGIPLVTGANLVAQYTYLNFPGELWVRSDGVRSDVPTFRGLGSTSRLYFVTP